MHLSLILTESPLKMVSIKIINKQGNNLEGEINIDTICQQVLGHKRKLDRVVVTNQKEEKANV